MQRIHSSMGRTMSSHRQDFCCELAHVHPLILFLSNGNAIPFFVPCAVSSSSFFRVMVGRWKLFSPSTPMLLHLDEWCCYAHLYPFVCAMYHALIILFRVMVGRWKLFSPSTSMSLRLDGWCCYAHLYPFVCAMCCALIILFRVMVGQWRMVTRPTPSGLYFR